MNWKIPLFKIYSDEDDINQVSEVIRSGMNWATGPKVIEFEDKIRKFVGTDHAVTFNSGTSALHALLLAYDIGKEDEVIVPSFTFIATANAPLFVGAKPIFADIEKTTYGLDPNDVLERITKKTKVIMPIHMGGCPCQIQEIREIADDHNLILIEDAAESLGAAINDKKVGTFGDSAMFSFCGPKVVTTGEGGVITTNSQNLAEKMKLIRSHGRADTKDYFSTNEYLDYIKLGYNFRMSNISAALGISQLKKINTIIDMRRENAIYLDNRISQEISDVTIPQVPAGYYHLYQMYTIYVSKNRDALMNHLSENGIMAKVYFPPVHLSHFYKNVLKYSPKLPVTEEVADQVLTLPMYPHLTHDEMDYMVETMRSYYEAESV